ncbi:hypothetical protein Ancab_032476, partial [Ancistrocladus abbreviatus]
GWSILGTLKAIWNLHAAGFEKQLETERDVEDDSENISFNGSAKADSGLKVNKALNQGAAWLHWRCTNVYTQQAVQQIGTYSKFQGIPRACGATATTPTTRARSSFLNRSGRSGRGWCTATSGEGKEEEVEEEKQTK